MCLTSCMEISLLLEIISRVTTHLSSVEIFSCHVQMQNIFNDKIVISEHVLPHASSETSINVITLTQLRQPLTELITSTSMFYIYYFKYW